MFSYEILVSRGTGEPVSLFRPFEYVYEACFDFVLAYAEGKGYGWEGYATLFSHSDVSVLRKVRNVVLKRSKPPSLKGVSMAFTGFMEEPSVFNLDTLASNILSTAWKRKLTVIQIYVLRSYRKPDTYYYEVRVASATRAIVYDVSKKLGLKVVKKSFVDIMRCMESRRRCTSMKASVTRATLEKMLSVTPKNYLNTFYSIPDFIVQLPFLSYRRAIEKWYSRKKK